MPRKLGLFLVISLLSMQLLSMLHMDEYNFQKHEHDGEVCSIYLYTEQSQSAGDAYVTGHQGMVFPAVLLGRLYQPQFPSGSNSSVLPRAPPVYS